MTQIGEKLPNGATLLASRPGSGGYNVVLGFAPEESPDEPFITWKAVPVSGETFWGDYFSDIADAVHNYEERT